MFKSYDVTQFSARLKSIRTNLNHTQQIVSKSTGINIDTIRKIENGYSLPRYDTLSLLSSFYKINLHEVFNTYNSSYVLYKFYIDLDRLIDQNNFEKLQIQYDEFLKELATTDHLHLVNTNDLTQLSMLVEAIQHRYSESYEDWVYAKETLVNALRLNDPDFQIENFHVHRYTYFELRILLVLSAVLGDLKECIPSNNIAEYLLAAFDDSHYNAKGEDKLIVKCYALISYNYHRLDQHKLALSSAVEGINYCIIRNTTNIPPFLLLRKGIAEYYLNDTNSLKSLRRCLNQLDILGDCKQLDYYKKTLLERYDIVFDNI